MSNSEFISNFIANCVDDGVYESSDICSIAEKEIEEIDEKIKTIENMKMRKLELRSVIKTFVSKRKLEQSSNDFSLPEKKLDDTFHEMCVKICSFIENNESATPRILMDTLSSLENNRLVYGSFQWLSYNGILKRTEDERRLIVKGDKWEDRPKSRKES